MKYIFCLALICSYTSASQTSSLCSVEYGGHYLSSLKLDDQRVDIIGWDHPNSADTEILENTYVVVADLVDQNKCQQAVDKLEATIKAESPLLKKVSDVLNTVETIDQAHHIDVIGREISPEEWSNLSAQFEAVDWDFNKMELRCGSEISKALKRFRLMLFGPESAFIRSHPLTIIDPFESFQARNANKAAFHTPVKEDFDDEANPHNSLASFKNIRDSLFTQKIPAPEDIRQLAKDSGGDFVANERQLQADIRVWQSRVAGAFDRDDAIVSHINRLTGHAVIVIGDRHVPDLTKRLKNSCLKRSSDIK